jgi:hypothetical protein
MIFLAGGFATGGGPPLPTESDLFVATIWAAVMSGILVALALAILWGAWCYWVGVRRCGVCGQHQLRDRRGNR